MAQSQPGLYERNALALLRDAVSRASPGADAGLLVSATDCGVGVIKVAIRFEPVISARTTPLHPDEVVDLPSSSNLDDVLSAIAASAEPIALAVDFTKFIDARNGYPRLSSDFEVSPSLSAYVHHGVCSGCAGKKVIPCSKCRAQGGFRCMTCDGTGETRCSHCIGSESCQVCHGRRRIECRSCFGTRLTRCRHCKGKKKLKCEPCHATGVLRTIRSAALLAHPSYQASVTHGPPDLLARSLDLAGGPRLLSSSLGSPTLTSISPTEAVYEVRVPYCKMIVSLDGHTSSIAISGTDPSLIESGNFLEHLLASDLQRLEAQVADSSSFFCNQSALRSALRTFLASRSHQRLVASPGESQHGVSSSYGARSTAAVTAAVSLMRANLLVSRAFAFFLVAGLAYSALVALMSFRPLALLPWFLACATAVWLSVHISMAITTSSLSDDADVRRRLRSL